MTNLDLITNGYVYILEVKDIQLPVCKIGMTRRDPFKRCLEINKSSTGDFIWAVAHYVTVDNCKKLETLVHSKLSPLRQKGREFFNITSDDAYQALISIIETQEEVKMIDTKEINCDIETKPIHTSKRVRIGYKQIDSDYADLLQNFAALLQVKGKPFGQLNKPIFGMSDGNRGVQWNLTVMPKTGEVRLGVNLEGSETTGKWLISSFILSQPEIENIKVKVSEENDNNIFIRFSRDAWQGASRLNIVEEYIGGREFSLAEMEPKLWGLILKEALTCLDPNRGYRKRKQQQMVTLKSDKRRIKRDISPHLTIWSAVSMSGDIRQNLNDKLVEMKHIYNWVVKSCQ